jgi:DNA repair protein RadC
MSESAGGNPFAIPGSEEGSSTEQWASDEQLLAKLLSDHVTSLSGSDRSHALVAAYGDLGGILRTEPDRLRLVVPLSNEEISLLKIMRRAADLAFEKDVMSRPVIGSLSALLAYLGPSSKRDVSLGLRALLLDQSNRLQADVPRKDKVEPEAVMTARELVQVALEHGASAVIVVESGGRASTSFEAALINQAKIVQRSLKAVDIVLHDYVRRSGVHWLSMRASGLL